MILSILRPLLLLVLFVALGLPVGLILIPWTLISGDVGPLYRAAVWVVRVAFRLAAIPLQVEGLERIPPGVACMFMSNHVSNLDPPLLVPLIPGRTSVFLKRSLMRIPLLGYGMRLGEFVPVDRGGNVEGVLESQRQAKDVLSKGIHITTFVEGTRSADGRMLPFKKGPFVLAMQTGAPCIPVSISGTESMMPKGSLRIGDGVARVVFHAPIYPAELADRDALMEAVRAAVASGLPAEMQ